jgi:hypothetical protein
MTALASPRIAQLIRLLASDREGEVLAAVRALRRTLASAGADFHDLAQAVENAAVAPSPRTDRRSSRPRTSRSRSAACESIGWQASVRWLLDHPARLTPRGREFVEDMAGWAGKPTKRQAAWLLAILERVGGFR